MSDRPASKAATDTTRGRNIDRVVFDLVLVAFLAVFVVTALDLRTGSRLVPLLVGTPALAAMLIRTVLDITGRVADHRAPDHVPETAEDEGVASASFVDLARAAQREVAADEEVPDEDDASRRRLQFTLWAFGFVLVAMLGTYFLPPVLGLHTYFLPAAAVALPLILGLGRVGWIRSIAISGTVIAAMYYLLITFLNVRL